MKTLTTVEFSPPGTLKIHLSEEVGGLPFYSSSELSLADFSESEQAIAAQSLGWLAAQLGALNLSAIILNRVAYTDESDAPAFRIVAAVSGQSAAGFTTIPQGALTPPADISAGLLEVWDAVEIAANS